jgi:hypothetical protein
MVEQFEINFDSETIEGAPKPCLSESDARKQLEAMIERMGSRLQEPGFEPVVVFVTDVQFAELKQRDHNFAQGLHISELQGLTEEGG